MKLRTQTRTLYPHQQKAFEYAKPLSRIALFMEMRLGKTLVTIHWINHNKKDIKNVLILSPKAVSQVWKSELEKESICSEILEGTVEQRFTYSEYLLQSKKRNWIITNYETVTFCRKILELPWDAIVLDESTRIRNPQSELGKILTRNQKIPYRAILSGFPAPESEMDYFNQMVFLYGNFMHETNFWHWRNKYYFQIGYEWFVKPSLLTEIKKAVKEVSFFMTRKEANMGSKKVYEKRYVEINSDQKRFYSQVLKDYACGDQETKYAIVQSGWLTQIAGGFTPKKALISDGKTKEILDLLQSDLKKEKVIIWFRYNHELDHVYTVLTSAGIKVGKYTSEKKIGLKPSGEFEDSLQVMCAQGKCGMMGLPWHASSAMIFYSNWYDGEIRYQCEDRGLHPAKKEPYLIIDLLSKDTIDEDVLDILRKKKYSSKLFLAELVKKIKKA